MVNTRSALYHIHEMILTLLFFHRLVFVCFEYIVGELFLLEIYVDV